MENRFGVARQSLAKNGYEGIVVGYSWDADTQFDLGNLSGYRRAKRNAIANGKKLAQFLFDSKARCPEAQSAGGRLFHGCPGGVGSLASPGE